MAATANPRANNIFEEAGSFLEDSQVYFLRLIWA